MADEEAESTDRERHLAAMNEVLRVAAHDNNLFRRETFEALARVLSRYLPLDCLAIVVPDPAGKRLYAASLAEGGRPLPPFGARFPHSPKEESVLTKGTIKLCDDTRNAETLDQIAVQWGFLSYAIVPIRQRSWTLEDAGRPSPPAREETGAIVGKVIVAFREPGFASKAPIDLLQLLASLFGETFDRSVTRTRERRLAMILETSGDAMLAWDEDGRISDANVAAATLIGASRAALIGTPISEVLDLDELPPPSAAPRAVRTTLTPRSSERSEPITVSVTMTAVQDDPLVSMHALIRDESHVVIAEREAAHHLSRVHELEKELRTLLDNAPLIIFRLDACGGVLKYLNRHAERVLGVPTSEALHTPGFLRALHRDPDALRAFDGALEHARAGRASPSYEARLQWHAGHEIAVRGTIYPHRGDDGAVVAIEGILADVSAEHAARSRAIQADRLSIVGLLAASVAHEINNPASFILLGLGTMDKVLSVLAEAEPSATSARELLKELNDSTKRIVRIARDLRLFASPSREAPESASVVDVNEVVESALSLARGRIMERASLVTDLSDVPPVRMDAGRLGQVLLNLLVNAADAITKGSESSTVEIVTRRTESLVEILVSDTGSGISKENLQRIWAPFFTTKSPDAGTGLGLSISRDIITRAGGEIRVVSPTFETASGPRGSLFILSLPAAGDSCTSWPPPPARAVGRRSFPRRRVLIVDDERPLARALAEELEVHHDVAIAYDAASALRQLAKTRFDTVLCDLRMPGTSGESLYGLVRQQDPEQARAFVFMSGIGFVPEVERFLAASGRPLLQKPFEPGRVLAAIAETTDAPDDRPGAPATAAEREADVSADARTPDRRG
ncbi:MAG: PAS domain S-box protein [Labilithrix sp.]|nr:PAS domain S-box protein [Labilithrix sp.]